MTRTDNLWHVSSICHAISIINSSQEFQLSQRTFPNGTFSNLTNIVPLHPNCALDLVCGVRGCICCFRHRAGPCERTANMFACCHGPVDKLFLRSVPPAPLPPGSFHRIPQVQTLWAARTIQAAQRPPGTRDSSPTACANVPSANSNGWLMASQMAHLVFGWSHYGSCYPLKAQ